MKALRLILFLLIFTVEFRVRAENVHLSEARSLMQEPEACWQKLESSAGPCAVGTVAHEKSVLRFDAAMVTLDRSTAIVRLSDNEIRFISGQVWIKASSEFVVRTEFGSVVLDPGEYWLDRTTERVRIGTVSGLAKLSPRGSKEVLQVSAALENWLGKVGEDGEARRGVPVAMDFKSHLSRWARLYPGSLKDFQEEARAFRDVWLPASELASEIHKTLFEQKVARLRAEHEKSERARRKADERTRELIRMFRKKVLEP